MIVKVISGGQSGTDQAALRAAKSAGIPTGGYAPKGWTTEAGPAPRLADAFGLREYDGGGYAARTRANVRDADATLLFEAVESPGTELTIRECDRLRKPFHLVMLDVVSAHGVRRSASAHTPSSVADWIAAKSVRVLNVAGNRDSRAPGIGKRVHSFLSELFRLTNPPAEGTPDA
jgi:hypothetical protein